MSTVLLLQAMLKADSERSMVPSTRCTRRGDAYETAIDYAVSPRRTTKAAPLLLNDVLRNGYFAVSRSATRRNRMTEDVATLVGHREPLRGVGSGTAVPLATGKAAGTASLAWLTPEDFTVAADLCHRLRMAVLAEVGDAGVRVFDTMADELTVPESAALLRSSVATVERYRRRVRTCCANYIESE